MKERKKAISLYDVPRLTGGTVEYEEIKFYEAKNRKIRRVYVLYFVTVGLIFVFCATVLLSLVAGALTDIYDKIRDDILNVPSLNDSLPVDGIFDTMEDILNPEDTSKGDVTEKNENTENNSDDKMTLDKLYSFDYSKVPDGEIPIIPMDLSLSSYGSAYIHNSTGLAPDVNALLSAKLSYGNSFEYLSASSPTVLIIHTHGTEAYSEDGLISYKDNGKEIARSSDPDKGVVAVGRELNKALRKRGILSVHCEIMHDESGYRDAYSRAEGTIKEYLERYPTIRLVIDLHRDSIVTSEGELVRPVTLVDEKEAAQIMCVVGSDWGGDDNDRWEANLALALQFRENINGKYDNVCRPVYLKSSTYNQELAPYSLLLEVGACGNSLEEALAVCDIMADAIQELLF